MNNLLKAAKEREDLLTFRLDSGHKVSGLVADVLDQEGVAILEVRGEGVAYIPIWSIEVIEADGPIVTQLKPADPEPDPEPASPTLKKVAEFGEYKKAAGKPKTRFYSDAEFDKEQWRTIDKFIDHITDSANWLCVTEAEGPVWKVKVESSAALTEGQAGLVKAYISEVADYLVPSVAEVGSAVS